MTRPYKDQAWWYYVDRKGRTRGPFPFRWVARLAAWVAR